MKVKCKEKVQDKHTGEWYEANKEYELPKERAEEVVKAYNGRYFEIIEELVKEEIKDKLDNMVKYAENVQKVLKEEEQAKPKRTRKSTKK